MRNVCFMTLLSIVSSGLFCLAFIVASPVCPASETPMCCVATMKSACLVRSRHRLEKTGNRLDCLALTAALASATGSLAANANHNFLFCFNRLHGCGGTVSNQ